MKKYSCAKCANISSPLCEYCTVVEVPSGKEHRPKYFVGNAEIGRSLEGNIPTFIKESLNKGKSIPLIAVFRYNKDLENQSRK